MDPLTCGTGSFVTSSQFCKRKSAKMLIFITLQTTKVLFEYTVQLHGHVLASDTFAMDNQQSQLTRHHDFLTNMMKKQIHIKLSVVLDVRA